MKANTNVGPEKTTFKAKQSWLPKVFLLLNLRVFVCLTSLCTVGYI